ncbi:hypothetical protein, partial [Staphylococcus aureus]|uniref:hypothetical protein n=1 Tax=Staphylococcus aureus TaxID=1280 RepID=UPI0015C1BD5C
KRKKRGKERGKKAKGQKGDRRKKRQREEGQRKGKRKKRKAQGATHGIAELGVSVKKQNNKAEQRDKNNGSEMERGS